MSKTEPEAAQILKDAIRYLEALAQRETSMQEICSLSWALTILFNALVEVV